MKTDSRPHLPSQQGIIHLGIVIAVVLLGAGLVVLGPKLYTDFVGAKVDIKQTQCKGCDGQYEFKWNNKSRACKKAKTTTCIKASQKKTATKPATQLKECDLDPWVPCVGKQIPGSSPCINNRVGPHPATTYCCSPGQVLVNPNGTPINIPAGDSSEGMKCGTPK